MDKIFELVGVAGFPSTIVGGIIFMFFYLRKQEAGIRTEQVGTMKRIQDEKVALQAELRLHVIEANAAEEQIDKLRVEKHTLEDQLAILKRQMMLAGFDVETGVNRDNI